MMRSLLSALSPGGDRGRLSILIFHRVLDRPDPMQPGEVDAVQFDEICRWIGELFNTLPLDEAATRLRDGTLPSRALAITFDDGYEDNYRVALPILTRHRLPATFFIATGFLDGGCMWNDVVVEALRCAPGAELDLRGIDGCALSTFPLRDPHERSVAAAQILKAVKHMPLLQRLEVVEAVASRAVAQPRTDLMMSSAQVVSLYRAGMQIGAHTQHHPILAVLGPDEIRREIGTSKAELEGLIGARVSLFAYPNGRPKLDYNSTAVDIARDLGFTAAVTTAWGAGHSGVDLMQLPRFTPWDRDRWRFVGRLAHSLWASRQAGTIATVSP